MINIWYTWLGWTSTSLIIESLMTRTPTWLDWTPISLTMVERMTRTPNRQGQSPRPSSHVKRSSPSAILTTGWLDTNKSDQGSQAAVDKGNTLSTCFESTSTGLHLWPKFIWQSSAPNVSYLSQRTVYLQMRLCPEPGVVEDHSQSTMINFFDPTFCLVTQIGLYVYYGPKLYP